MQDYSVWNKKKKPQHYPCLNIKQYLNARKMNSSLNFLYINLSELSDRIIDKIKDDQTIVLLLNTLNKHGLAEQRRIFIKLINSKIDVPIIIGRVYEGLSTSVLQLLQLSSLLGPLYMLAQSK